MAKMIECIVNIVKKFTRSRYFAYISVLLLCLIPRIIWSSKSIPLRTPSDEFSTMFFGAKLAGYKWEDVQSYANYYGFGMNLISFWIFKLPISMVYKYRMLLGICGVFQSLTGIIAYKILSLTTDIKKMYKFLIAVASSYMVCTRTTVYYNEHGLILITWIIALLIVELVLTEEKTTRIIYSSCLVLTLGYSLTLHTRSITYFIAFVIIAALARVVSKKNMVNLFVILPLLIIVYLLVGRFVVDKYIATSWITTHRDLSNSVVNTNINVSASSFGTIILMVCGQLGTIFATSGGMILVGICSIIFGFTRLICNKQETEDGQIALTYVGVWALMCVGATILYQANSWGVNAAVAVATGEKNAYVYKCFTYIRYMGPYLGPIFMIGCITIDKINDCAKVFILGCYAVIGKVFIAFVAPIVETSNVTMEAFRFFSKELDNNLTASQFSKGIIIGGVVLAVILLMAKYKKMALGYIGITLFLTLQYHFNTQQDINSQSRYADRVNASIELVEGVNDINKDFIKDIYVDDQKKEDQQFFYTLQFCLDKCFIHPELPEKEVDNMIIISNDYASTFNRFSVCSMSIYAIDDNEYLLTNSQTVNEYAQMNYRKIKMD